MTVPTPELNPDNTITWPDDLTPDEMNQARAVAAAPVGDDHRLVKSAAALGGAFLLYRQYMRSRLRNQLKGVDDLPPDQFQRTITDTFNRFVPAWTYMVTPSIFSSLLVGVEESGFPMGTQTLHELATRYSWNLGFYLNGRAIDSAKRGYRAQLNRRMERKLALANSIEGFAVTLPGTRSLVNLWSKKKEPSPSENVVPSEKVQANRIINSDLKNRAELIGDQETFSVKETGKELAWTFAQQLGIIPDTATRKWVTAKDEKVCPLCGPLHGMEVPINQPFEIGGKKYWSPGLHINCRCTVKLKAHFGQKAGYSAVNLLQQENQWTSADDSVAKAAGRDVVKADKWDYREHPRDQRSGRFSDRPVSRPTTFKEPSLQETLDQMQEIVDTADIEQAQNMAVIDELLSRQKPQAQSPFKESPFKENPFKEGQSAFVAPPKTAPPESAFTTEGRSAFDPQALSAFNPEGRSAFSPEGRSAFNPEDRPAPPMPAQPHPTPPPRKPPEGPEKPKPKGGYMPTERLYGVFTQHEWHNHTVQFEDNEELHIQQKHFTSSLDDLQAIVENQEKRGDLWFRNVMMSDPEIVYQENPDGTVRMLDPKLIQQVIDWERDRNLGFNREAPHVAVGVYDKGYLSGATGRDSPYLHKIRNDVVKLSEVAPHMNDRVRDYLDHNDPMIVAIDWVDEKDEPKPLVYKRGVDTIVSDEHYRLLGSNAEHDPRLRESHSVTLGNRTYSAARYGPVVQ